MKPSRLTIGHALGHYVLYVTVFIIGGGIGAGVPSFLFQTVTGTDPAAGQNIFLYAVIFGVTGTIAYRLARRVVE